jgi:uncharacterized protein YhaN
MRLTSFSLENYGNFANARLALDPQPGHLNLIGAPNGGGKTVLRQAFHDLLFGISGQTKMAFRHGYQGMRLFAEGIDAAGATFAFGRRKGIGNTVVDAAGNSLDPSILRELIGEADEALFERMFGLDSYLLRAGAEAMLASGGDLAEALFAAGSGIASVRRLREKFEEVRDQLAPGRQTRSRPLYQALEKLAGAHRELRAAMVRPRDWQDLRAQLDFVRERRASLAREQAQIRNELERLQRIKRVRPWLEQLQDARQRYAAVAEVPQLPPDTPERWRTAREMVDVAARELGAATAALQSIAAAVSDEKLDEKLLDQGPHIEDLERAQNQIASDQRDLPRRDAERKETAARLDNALSALGVKAFDDIAAIFPNGPQIAAARDLVKRYAILTERLEKAASETRRHQLAIAAAETELDRIGESPDLSDLAAVVAAARAEGEPRRRLSSLQTKLEQEETRLAAALAKVPLWKRGLERLVALVPPAREMINRAATALGSATGALAEAEREVERLRRECAEAADQREEASEGKPVPDAAAVAAARSYRDRGWSLVRRTKFEGESLQAEVATYAERVGLAEAFERAVSDVDDLVDRRDEESSRLATIAALDGTIAKLKGQSGAAKRRLADAHRWHEDALREWRAIVGALGFETVPDPADLRDFLAARAIVVDARMARDAAQQAVATEAAEQEAMRLRFAQLMPPERGSLSEALVAAEQVINGWTAKQEQRNRLQAELETVGRLYYQAVEDRKAADVALENWEGAWRECLSNLKRPAEETPAGLERAIEMIEEAHRGRQHLVTLDHRIGGMRGNIAEFNSRVVAVICAVAPDLNGQPAETAARELRHRLDTNRKIETRRDQLLDQQKQAQAKCTKAEIAQRQAEAARESLRDEIGGGSDDEILSRLQQAFERARAELKVQECEGELAKIGEGRAIPVLEDEIAAVAAETLELEFASLELAAERVTKDREQAAVEEQRLAEDLRRIETGENAIEAEECRQAAIASVTRISAEALLYHAAACLLQAGLDRLRDGGDSRLLRRVGTVFTRITGGAYSGIDADEDENCMPFLIAIEGDSTTTKRVHQLSEGTRDQLFLALRLVMLEDYAARATAPPFIADDLLQTFDDYGRTANALMALADLSQHVQVIVLTHHRQLLEMAKTLPMGTVHLCEFEGKSRLNTAP